MPKKPTHQRRSGARPQGVTVRRSGRGAGWELVHPKGVVDRADDLDEVRQIIEHEELEIATDELRWLLSECSDFIEAHVMLGELAVLQGEDLELARGHFGFAYELGDKALRAAGCQGPLLYENEANRPWFEAARGLAWAFEKQGAADRADTILTATKALDPADAAGIGAMLDDLRSGGLPVVGLE